MQHHMLCFPLHFADDISHGFDFFLAFTCVDIIAFQHEDQHLKDFQSASLTASIPERLPNKAERSQKLSP